MELKQHQQSRSNKSDWANSTVYKITRRGGAEPMENTQFENGKKKTNPQTMRSRNQHTIISFIGTIDAGWMDRWMDGWIDG